MSLFSLIQSSLSSSPSPRSSIEVSFPSCRPTRLEIELSYRTNTRSMFHFSVVHSMQHFGSLLLLIPLILEGLLFFETPASQEASSGKNPGSSEFQARPHAVSTIFASSSVSSNKHFCCSSKPLLRSHTVLVVARLLSHLTCVLKMHPDPPSVFHSSKLLHKI